MEPYQKITVGGLLVSKGKVLVVRRSSKERFMTGYYELPGGKVDFGETPERSLEREFLEETNITVKVVEQYRVFSYISHEGLRHTVEIVYLVECSKEDLHIQLSEEHDDYQWIDENDLDKIKISDEIKLNVREGLKQWKSLQAQRRI